jgi:AcrR family transcriptional regulator
MYVKKRMTRRESQDATRASLLEAAEKTFIRFGFDGSSIDRITRLAGFSRGAFYSNFPDKDALFLAVLEKRRVASAGDLDAIFLFHRDAAGRLRAARDWYVEQFQEKRWIALRTEFQLRALRNRTVKKRLAALWRQELEKYAALIAQYFSEAGIPLAGAPESIALALLAAAQGLGGLALVDEDGTVARGAEAARDLVFDRLIAGEPIARKTKCRIESR